MRPLVLLLVLTASPALAVTCPPDWGYRGGNGPGNWGRHAPECVQGEAQSPIDLSGYGEAGELAPLSFHYDEVPLVVRNTARLLLVPADGGGYVQWGEARYELVQLHFHTPSEHTFRGQHAAGELHLVHRNAEGELLVVAVLLSPGGGHEALRRIAQRLPVAPCHQSEPRGLLDPASLLPAEDDSFTYRGSLTIPPCSENVRWVVMAQPLEASAQQLRALAPMGPNNRPTQPLHGRELLLERR